MPQEDRITVVIREQLARIEAQLKQVPKGHAQGPRKPSLGQQEDGE
jgi:hypothetical protein